MTRPGGARVVELTCGDITQQRVDAIVNAANSRLAGGGGVDGAIHRRGGPTLMAELRQRFPDGCPTGEAVATTGGQLACRWVLHAVGPVWQGGGAGEAALLGSAARACLRLAEAEGCRSVAFPALSCGAYGYPVEQAARVLLETVREWQVGHELPELVRFVLYDVGTLEQFESVWAELREKGTATSPPHPVGDASGVAPVPQPAGDEGLRVAGNQFSDA